MEHLIGTYECKVDTKGRVMMPIALKKQLSKLINEGFVLKRSVFNHCIEMYPVSEWSKLMDKLNGLNRFKKKITTLYVGLLLVLNQLKWIILDDS